MKWRLESDGTTRTAAYKHLDIRSVTATDYTLSLSDDYSLITFNTTSEGVIRIPSNTDVAFPVGTLIEVWQTNIGQANIQANPDVSLNGLVQGTTASQGAYSSASLRKVGLNAWLVAGGFDPVAVIPVPGQQNGIFGLGYNPASSTYYSLTNIVTSTGAFGNDVTTIALGRQGLAAATYGGDKGIFAFGTETAGLGDAYSQLVSNTGVMGASSLCAGTSRYYLGACSYGGDKAIFGFGQSGTIVSVTNLVSNTGVIASDTAGVGTARYSVYACGYGLDKGIFAFGIIPGSTSVSTSNLVSNTGVVATDTTNAVSARRAGAACGYGGDKGIMGYGYSGVGSGFVGYTNLVSSNGVIASDVADVGTPRSFLAACGYAGDRGVFAYGFGGGATVLNISNKVSNTGIVTGEDAGVGTARGYLAACSFGG